MHLDPRAPAPRLPGIAEAMKEAPAAATADAAEQLGVVMAEAGGFGDVATQLQSGSTDLVGLVELGGGALFVYRRFAARYAASRLLPGVAGSERLTA